MEKLSSLQPFQNIKQVEARLLNYPFESSVFLHFLFFFFFTSVSYFNFLCLLLRLLEAQSNFNSTPCVTAISYIVQSKLHQSALQ